MKRHDDNNRKQQKIENYITFVKCAQVYEDREKENEIYRSSLGNCVCGCWQQKQQQRQPFVGSGMESISYITTNNENHYS